MLPLSNFPGSVSDQGSVLHVHLAPFGLTAASLCHSAVSATLSQGWNPGGVGGTCVLHMEGESQPVHEPRCPEFLQDSPASVSKESFAQKERPRQRFAWFRTAGKPWPHIWLCLREVGGRRGRGPAPGADSICTRLGAGRSWGTAVLPAHPDAKQARGFIRSSPDDASSSFQPCLKPWIWSVRPG